jgi:hypothetical protein
MHTPLKPSIFHHSFVIRHLSFVISILLLGGCHSKHRPRPLPPQPIITSIPLPSITIDSSTGWMAAPTDGGMPLYTNQFYSIQYFPPTLRGTIMIQRLDTDTGFLSAKVSAPAPATLYVALLYEVNSTRLITNDQLAAFAKEGWQRVPGIFGTSSPIAQQWWWQVWQHNIDAGPVTIDSKAIPDAGIFFIGRQH